MNVKDVDPDYLDELLNIDDEEEDEEENIEFLSEEDDEGRIDYDLIFLTFNLIFLKFFNLIIGLHLLKATLTNVREIELKVFRKLI